MTISVITIVYNDKDHIEDTLLNVINQTAIDHIEYIVIDGASTDGTVQILEKYKDKIDILVSEPDRGIYDAMNKGLRIASGDYVVYMNSGDCFSSLDTIKLLISMVGQSRPDIIYGHYREVNNSGCRSKIIPCRSYSKIWYGPVASHQSTLYRTNFLKSNGVGYDVTYKIAADYKLTAEAITKAGSIRQLDLCISDFDVSGVSSTNQNQGLIEANRIRREVFGWNSLQIAALSGILLSARITKKYFRPVYNLLREKI